jgi:hypothetical protein
MSLERFADDPTMAGRGRVPDYVGEPGRSDAALAPEAGGDPAASGAQPEEVVDVVDEAPAPVADPPAAVGVAAAPHVTGPGERVLQPDENPNPSSTYSSASAAAETDTTDGDDDTDYDAEDAKREARMENDVDQPADDDAAAAAAGAGSLSAVAAAARERAIDAGEVINHRSRERRRGRNVLIIAAAALGAAAVGCLLLASNPKESPDQTNQPPATVSPERPTPPSTDPGEDDGNEEEEDVVTLIPPLDELPETYDGTSTWPWGDAANEVGPARANEHLQDQIASAKQHGATVETFEVTDDKGRVVRWGVLRITYPAVDGSTQVATSTEDVVDVLDYYGNLN